MKYLTEIYKLLPNALAFRSLKLTKICIFGAGLACLPNAFAAENEELTISQRSTSIGQVVNEALEQQTATESLPTEGLNRKATLSTATNKLTREQVQAQYQSLEQLKSHNNNQTTVKITAQSYCDDNLFAIYNAYHRLTEDHDYDGFYQSFDIVFDADVYPGSYYDYAEVYAEIYLSRDGSDWQHFTTTENFTLHAQDNDDKYQLRSNLEYGYRTGYYDVLIDLYEVGYSDVVATMSSDDNGSLYGLPLESADRDYYYDHEYAGSLTLWSLLTMLGIWIFRQKLEFRESLSNTNKSKLRHTNTSKCLFI